MTRANMGSPKGREPYGDRVPVVVAGVTTCQRGTGRPSTGPRGTGDRILRPKGMRNAERRVGDGCPPRPWQHRGVGHRRATYSETGPVWFGGGPAEKGSRNREYLAARPI